MKTNKISTRSMALLAVLVAIQIVLSRQFAIETQLVKFSFAFVATFLMGLFLGPWLAGIGGVLADVIGMSLLAKSPFFIGFTLSAFLGGVVYGLYFYNKEVTLKRCIACVLTNTVLFTLILTPIWLSIMYNIPLNSWAIWSVRLMKLVITIPLEVATLYIVGKALPMAQLKRKLS